MFNIYDSECPVCRGQKKVRILEITESGEVESVFEWGYVPSDSEKVVEAFCSECGIKFVYPH